ncbi:MAG: DUF4249 family protein [Bacteroidales bacterium]|nr:DUF4249 family protein [Bacteroidales bacterium]
MRTYIYYIIIATLLCCSCIDEFEADLPSSDTRILCVEGSIRGNTECTFYLSHGIPIKLDDDEIYDGFAIWDAEIAVHGSDGQIWQGHNIFEGYTGSTYDKYNGYGGFGFMSGTYVVPVGQLDPSTEYWLEINWNDNTYISKPQLPLPTPEIQDLKWEMSLDGQYVNIMVTPAPTDTKEQYYRWSYEETWEVHTPLVAFYEYVPEQDLILPVNNYLNVGWAHANGRFSKLGSNENYQDGQINNLVVYQVHKDEDRFVYRYYTRVYQTAITREEYEYENLSRQLSYEMGGLFTPQPSALPTNIECKTANLQAIGYIGVSLNTTSAHVYANRNAVNHVDMRVVQMAEDDYLLQAPWLQLWQWGWRVYEYIVGSPFPPTWTRRWCVDCTDPSWGASLERPSFWVDKEE